MKLLDRTIAISFIKNYLISFLILVGMYVVLDMVFNFDEFVEYKPQQAKGVGMVLGMIWYIAEFYFYQIFLFFSHLSGIIPVAAAAFTVIRMVRFNELSALLSAGVPLRRLMAPILIVGAFLNGLLWVDQEYVIPNIIHKLVRRANYGASTDGASFPITAMRDNIGNTLLTAGRFIPLSNVKNAPRMDMVSIQLLDEKDALVGQVRSDAAFWNSDKRRWDLFMLDKESGKLVPGGFMDSYSPDLPITTEPIGQFPLNPDETCGVSPEEIQLYKSGNYVEFLSLDRINELLKRSGSHGKNHLLGVKHFRGLVQITINMILLTLGTASVLTREPKNIRSTIGKCIFVCGGCMGMVFCVQQMAANPPAYLPVKMIDLWPILMAWVPVFIFGPAAVIMTDRIKT